MQLTQARDGYVRWLRATRDLSPHTLRAYGGDLLAFERHAGPECDVSDLDAEIVVSFVERQKAAGLSTASLRRRASALRGFCSWLRAQGLIEVEPWEGTLIAPGRARRLPRVLSGREVGRLLDFLEAAARLDRDRDDNLAAVEQRPHESTTFLAVALMVATGVRVHEAVGIRCADVDLPGRTVRLVGKGGRERQVFLPNKWIVGLTTAYLEARAGLGLEHPYLLFNLRHEPLTPAAMRSRLAKAAMAAGLDSHITPHMLRHTAATQLIEAGVDIRYIQRLLGHASLSTTEIYTHVSDRALKRVVSDADILGRVAIGR